MAAQVTTNPLAHLIAKGKAASDKNKKVEVEYDTNGGLPPGIEGGVAQLDSVTIGKYKKGKSEGKPYVLFSAIVKLPLEHDGVPTEGMRTSIGPRPIEETEYSSMEDNIVKIQDDFKRLLGPAAVSNPELVGIENWASTCALLTKAKPTFRFRTWKGEATAQYPNPRVNHTWGKLCDPVASRPATNDQSANPPAAVPAKKVATTPAVAPKAAAGAGGKPPVTKAVTKAAPEPEPESVPEVDVLELGTLADADPPDTDAIATLQEMAEAAGIEKDAEDNWPGDTWFDLAALLAAAETIDSDGAGDETAEGVAWEAGNAATYQGKEVEVLTVDTDKGVATLKDLQLGRTIANPKGKGKLNPKTKKIELPPLEVPLDELEAV